MLFPCARCIDECGINISKEATVKGIVFSYNCNKILCCPSSGNIYSINIGIQNIQWDPILPDIPSLRARYLLEN
jgi:hypothetical protein